MRWFPVKLRVLLDKVFIDLYIMVMLSSLCRNVLTSLYVRSPPERTEHFGKLNIIKFRVHERNEVIGSKYGLTKWITEPVYYAMNTFEM